MSVLGWLDGDVVRTANSADLTLPGSPKVIGKPGTGKLKLSGAHHFVAGESLVIGVSKFTPNGLIAVVKTVSVAGGDTTISYAKGGLLTAFDELNLVAQLPAATSKKDTDPRRTARRPGFQVPGSGHLGWPGLLVQQDREHDGGRFGDRVSELRAGADHLDLGRNKLLGLPDQRQPALRRRRHDEPQRIAHAR